MEASLSTEQFPVSAYVGSSKNLKDLKVEDARLRVDAALQGLGREPPHRPICLARVPALENRCVVVTEAGSYLRLIDICITQLKAQGHSRTCNESKEDENKCLRSSKILRLESMALSSQVFYNARIQRTLSHWGTTGVGSLGRLNCMVPQHSQPPSSLTPRRKPQTSLKGTPLGRGVYTHGLGR